MNGTVVETDISMKKKSKKRKHEKSEIDMDEPCNKKIIENIESNQTEINEKGSENQFSWKNTIFEIISAKGEISLKKLKKKVVAQYLKQHSDHTHEKANSRFDKKIGKVCGIIIADDKVRLNSPEV